MPKAPPTPTPDNVPAGEVQDFNASGVLQATFTGSNAFVLGVNAADAHSNWTVSAGNGSYTGDLNITAAMTVESANGANHVTTTGDCTNGQVNAAVHIEHSNVTLGGDGHGLTVQADAAEASAVYIDTSASGSGANIVVDGNTIAGNAGHPTGGAILGGGGESHVTINDNSITSGSVYINGESNVGNPSTHVDFTNNDFAKGLFAVLDVSNSVVTGNHFDGKDGVIVLQSPGDTASDNNAEIQTVNGGFTLHGNETLVTTDDGGSSSNFSGEHQETDQVLNWDNGVGINLADNWVGTAGLTGTAHQMGSGEVAVAISNGGEIDLFANHVTVAQVQHDYGFS